MVKDICIQSTIHSLCLYLMPNPILLGMFFLNLAANHMAMPCEDYIITNFSKLLSKMIKFNKIPT